MTMMTMTMLKMNIILSALSLLLASSATANTIDLNVCARKMSIDVIFLIDICDKIDAAGYTSMKNLINSMGDVLLEKSSMGPFGVQLAVAQYYSTTKKAELAIKLNQFTDLASFKGKVNSLVKDSGTVLTKEETRLTDVEEDALRAVNGARAAVNKAIIIITDGYKDATDEAVPLRAAVLQDLGYYIYAVTVGTYPNTDLINKITNSKENILNVPSATDAEFNNIKNQLLLKTCSVAAAESTFSCKPVDVIFVLDQSISADNRVYARSFIIRVINDVITNVGPNGAQVGLVIYGNAIKTVFNLKNFTTKADLVNAVNGEWAAVGKFGSDIGGGLLRAVEIFKTPDLGGRTDAQKLVIMTFDGQAKNGNTLTDAANKLKELKAVRVVVDMNARPPVPFQDKQLAEAAGIATVTGGEGSDSATGNLAAYINPPSKIESVVSQIEGITTSKFCVASCKQPLDVVFVFDQSISASNKLQHTLNFVKSLINDVFTTIGPSGVQVGLILYGNQVAKQFDLNKYKTKAELITAITTPVTANTGQFGSAVGSGLEEAVTMFNGGRKDARKLVVLTFDGQAKDGTKLTDAANKLNEMKVVRVVIDINERPPVPFQDKQLAQAAGIKTVTAGVGSDSVTGSFAAFINPPDKLTALVPKVKALTRGQLCVPPPPPEIKCKPLDVVFVFDQSISASNKLQHTLNFVKSLINDVFTTIGPSGVQVGLILYGNQVAKQFDLNKYKTKAELITAITTPVTANTGQFGSAVGSGLEEAVTMFNGGRKDARKLVVLTFDGQAKDGTKLTDAANKLNEMKVVRVVIDINERPPVPFQDKQLAQAAGIKTVTAGVGSDSVTGSFAAFINPPDKLAALVPKMKTLTRGQLCVALPTTGQPGPVGPPPKCSKIDVLIGCDASGSISASDWSVMMKMVTETVKLLFGAKKNIRVGFYAFAVKPSLLVPLSKGLNAADVEKVISADKPRRLGYGTATSRMLRDASINGFNTDNGARNDSSKVMIVVYDGVSRSANWVKAAADELAAKGVMNIAVATPGVGNAKEFDYIAGKTGDKFVNSTAGKNKWDGYPAKIVELVDKVCSK